MKSNIPDDEFLNGNDLKQMLKEAGAMPKFGIMQKVWLKCGSDDAGMVIGVVTYANEYTYVVRFANGEKDEFRDYELTDAKTWG